MGSAALLLLAAVAVRLVDRDDAARAVDQLPGVEATVATTPLPSPSERTATAPAADGSTTSGSPTPAATPVPQNGTGKLTVVAVPNRAPASSGRTVRYTVEIEEGLGVDKAAAARTIQAVLLDPRGWQQKDAVRFVNVSPQQAARGAGVDIRVTLASPGLTDRLCAPLRTLSQVSCWNDGRSVLNFRRWALGDDSYGKDIERYRVYQVNHEVGHGLGHGHVSCPGAGKRAPIMVQQTLSLGGCTPWPYPSGA